VRDPPKQEQRGDGLTFSGPSVFIRDHIPHLAGLLRPEMADVASWAEACVVGASDDQLASVLQQRSDYKLVLDLHRAAHSDALRQNAAYRGASW